MVVVSKPSTETALIYFATERLCEAQYMWSKEMKYHKAIWPFGALQLGDGWGAIEGVGTWKCTIGYMCTFSKLSQMSSQVAQWLYTLKKIHQGRSPRLIKTSEAQTVPAKSVREDQFIYKNLPEDSLCAGNLFAKRLYRSWWKLGAFSGLWD